MNKNYVMNDDGEKMMCPIRFALDIVGSKWKQPIICMLSEGKPLRNGAIKRRLTGVTNIMLSQSLRELESCGIVHRKQYNEVPPKVEYTLTEKGHKLIPALLELCAWSEELMKEEKACISYCNFCKKIAG